MISPSEACQYVQQEIPEVGKTLTSECDIYTALSAVQEYAIENAKEQNYTRLQQCFNIVESLYDKGTGVVKSAVENVFIYSISRLCCQAPEVKRRIKALIPESLHEVYTAQVLHHGY
jgi:hypothetical protein